MIHRYTEDVTNKKIAILGPYPPPLGGVAIHVRRIEAKLKRQKNNVRVFDTTARHRWRFYLYLPKLFFFLFHFRPHFVHYHTIYLSNSLPELRLLFFLQMLFRFKIMFVEHNCRHIHRRSDKFKKRLSEYIREQSIVFIGDSTYESYVRSDVMLPATFSIESAFLPPDEKREPEILATYPAELFRFVKTADPLIVANAFQLSQLEGKDLYGFDLCLQLLAKLKTTFPEAKLVFALARVGDHSYYKKLCGQIDVLGLKNYIFFLTDQKELWPLLKRADLFVRPTLSDSFGISVAEALRFGTPAVASDVCVRAEGTVMFRCGDTRDFYEKVLQVLKNKESRWGLKNKNTFKPQEKR